MVEAAGQPNEAGSPTIVSSPDGRSFRLRTSAEEGLRPGDYVRIADGTGVEHLGYVESVDEVTETTTWAAGSILPGPVTPAPFRSGSARRSDPAAVRDFFDASGASLPVGTLVSDPSVPVGLIPKRINRHTFWCGQSGSGKTYALGVALEQILLGTRLPMVIFDPNSDFVRLGETLPHVQPDTAGRLAERPVRVLRRGGGPDALRARLRSMDLASRGALMRLDPVIHREEFNAMVHHRFDPAAYAGHGDLDTSAFARSFETSADPGARALGRRLENLGLLEWEIWALDRPAATDVIAERPAATVLDLGSLERHEEQLTVALSVLNDLWDRREERRPVLLVIDEAHNLCSPDLESLLGIAVRNRIIQIAAEGRKYGLWLLLSTQRPSKVHPGIVSQCDNLTLMRMNSPNDLAELGDLFGFVPRQLLAQASRFRQGEALLAGGFVPAPTITTIAGRLTVEGGVDVRVPMP
ncbi:MAG TPA: ATP-binding protein [Microlunatus sp.]|nr:ATP-binding protein [Microlunatus sp.]